MIAIKGAIATGTAVAALLSAGCVSVLPEAAPPGPRYALAPVSTPDQYAELASNDAAGAGLAAARVSWSLAIEDPVASRAIDTTKIARVSEGFEYRYFAGGEWTDRAPRLVSLALARSFENSDRILNVGTRINVPLSDYVLQTDLRAFEAHAIDNDPLRAKAHVEIYARFSNTRGKVFAARRFSAEEQAASDQAGDVAAAIDAAASRVIADIVSWTLDEGERLQAK